MRTEAQFVFILLQLTVVRKEENINLKGPSALNKTGVNTTVLTLGIKLLI